MPLGITEMLVIIVVVGIIAFLFKDKLPFFARNAGVATKDIGRELGKFQKTFEESAKEFQKGMNESREREELETKKDK